MLLDTPGVKNGRRRRWQDAATRPDFVEALARGLDVLACFDAGPADAEPDRGRRPRPAWPGRPRAGCCSPCRSSATSASTAGRSRSPRRCCASAWPTSSSLGLWDIARPHLAELVAATARVVVDGPARRLRHRLRRPGRRAEDHHAAGGHRHPVPGAADLAGQGAARRARRRRDWPPCWPSRAGPACRRSCRATAPTVEAELMAVRARGWALADEELAPGIRSVAVPVRDGTGAVRAAMNVTVHAAETSVEHADRTSTCRSCCGPPARSAPSGRCGRPRTVTGEIRTAVRHRRSAGGRRMAPDGRPGPLPGIVVADFSRVLAGPYCTMLLADLGADVIKVESAAGDDTRHWVPPRRGDVGTYYLAVNRNKRSIVLDLADADDLAVAHALVGARRRDDPELQARRAGPVRARLRVGARARNPDVIYCSISGFGADKGAALPGYDLLVQAVSGLMSLTGSPDGPPYRAGSRGVRRDDRPALSAIGILAALHHRRPDRPGPAHRDQPAVHRAVDAGEPDVGLRRGRRGPAPDGQRAPVAVPVRAAARPATAT